MSNHNIAMNTAILGLVSVGGLFLGAYANSMNIFPFFKKDQLIGKPVTHSKAESLKEEPEEDSEEEMSEDEDEYEVDSTALNDIPGEVKMVLCIRQDLQMTKGKVAAQCCHAAVACYRMICGDPSRESYNLPMTQRWLYGGQAKITLKCPNEDTMDLLYAKAISLGVNSYVVHDAGRTQIASGSATVLGLGPAPKSLLDQITGELKLY